jgi:hypothetical protein
VSLGEGAEILAERYDISRAVQDGFALRSQQRAAAAWRHGRFTGEVVPVPGAPVERDEPVRDTTLDGLARLRPVFRPGGTVTAGNASPMNDGAAALLLAGEAARSRRGGAAPPPDADVTADEALVGYDAGDPEGLTLDQVGPRQALVIGFAQCIALFPGVSRSGTTIVAGMSAGLTRPAATRFSFLLALPALVGATVVSVPDLASGPSVFGPTAIIGGILAAFASGWLAIRWLLALVARDRLTGFALYCFAVGTLSLVALQLGA